MANMAARMFLQLVAALLVTAAAAAPEEPPDTQEVLAETLELSEEAVTDEDPARWSVGAVAAWVRLTAHLPEHAAAFETHAVDGATLMHLTDRDLLALNVTSAAHRGRLVAQLDLLRRQCSCGSRRDFWSLVAARPYRTLVLAGFVECAPRVAAGWLLLTDSRGLLALLNFAPPAAEDADLEDEDLPGWGTVGLAAALCLAVPHTIVAAIALRYITVNWFVMSVLALDHLCQQITETRVLAQARADWPGRASLRGFVSDCQERKLWLQQTLYPFVGVIVVPVLLFLTPSVVEVAVLWVYFIWILLKYCLWAAVELATWYSHAEESSAPAGSGGAAAAAGSAAADEDAADGGGRPGAGSTTPKRRKGKPGRR
eukprot:TRINITY_DN12355_c0_g1_i1.p1 TRINITY_DN12355_c0_g1~~TRINITY_DN12355_c0_g1_i1.p1  ORF type:complete len:371 (+),score=57.55 TRINITY_DN12355_c0_g1_i1:71-1183(+)